MEKVLIVDDDEQLRTNLLEFMTDAGYQAQMVSSGREAVEKASDEDFDVVLLDLMMPKMTGSDVLVELKRVSPRSRVIMITAFATIDNAVDAIKRGASDYVTKPFNINDLLMRIKRVLEETRIDSSSIKGDFDRIMSSLANSNRRTMIHLISQRKSMRLMDLARELEITDHTKVLFHIKILKEAGIVEQGADKLYSLSPEGFKAFECLKIIEKYFRE
jgi:DNA-binding NtrC family response regulator